ncbi:hypothetical protein DFJ73DRAFT_799568 [Zopfochytrium polystomum]|nr:hypothetical protein DFJ73DRAFT_799568 [Zopfochytrium polystomum]
MTACVAYRTAGGLALCDALIDAVSPDPAGVLVPPSALVAEQQSLSPMLVSLLASNPSLDCLNIALPYLCGYYIPECIDGDPNNLAFACKSTCLDFVSLCGPFLNGSSIPAACDVSSTGVPLVDDQNCLFRASAPSSTPSIPVTATSPDSTSGALATTSVSAATNSSNSVATSAATVSSSTTASTTKTVTTPSTASPSASPVTNGNSTASACPPPFEYSSRAPAAGACFAACCIPCPGAFYVERPGFIDNLWKFNYSILSSASAVSALIVILTFAFLPSRRLRKGHAVFVITLNLAIIVESIAVIMSIPQPSASLCDDRFSASTQQSNPRCLAQGIIVTFGLNAIVFSVALILANLHLTVVWKSQFFERNIVSCVLAVWILAAGYTAVPVSLRGIIASPGFICVVNPNNMYEYLFGPQIAVMALALVMQITTLVYSIANSRKSVPTTDEKRYIIRREIRTQWRAVFMAILFQISWGSLLGAFLQFRALYNVFGGLRTSPVRATWVYEWVQCLYANNPNGRTACYRIISANIPAELVIVIFISLHLLSGVFSLFIFVLSNKAVMAEWRSKLLPWLDKKRTTEIVVSSQELTAGVDPQRPRDYLKTYTDGISSRLGIAVGGGGGGGGDADGDASSIETGEYDDGDYDSRRGSSMDSGSIRQSSTPSMRSVSAGGLSLEEKGKRDSI